MKKNYVLMLLGILAVLSLCLTGRSSFADSPELPFEFELLPEEKAIIENMGMERFVREARAGDAYDRILNAFADNSTGEDGGFPDYYGGAFINEEGYLVVNLTKISRRIKNFMRDLAGEDDILFQKVAFSFSEQQNISRNLQNSVNNADDYIKENIAGFGIDQSQGLVRVYVKSNNESINKAIRQLTDKPEALIFVPIGNGIFQDDTDIDAGNSIMGASVAYRAHVLVDGVYVPGVMTAAHVVNYEGYIYTTDGIPFAKCIRRALGGSCDSAFCEIINNSFVPTNSLYSQGGPQLSTTTTNPAQGATVYKLGKNGLSGGTVLETDGTISVDGDTFIHLSFTTYNSSGGDSGGLVYKVGLATRYTAGIHKGHVTNSGGTLLYSFFTKADVQNSYLGVTRY